MHIALNCRSILKPQYTGIGRYTYNLIQSLTDVAPENQYTLYAVKRLFDFQRKLPSFKSSKIHAKMDWFKRGVDAVTKNVDIYHSPFPDVIAPTKAKVIVTIHDLVYRAFKEGHTDSTLDLTDKQMHSFLPFVSKIICCSKNTQDDLHQYFDIDRSKSCVVYQGVDKNVFYAMEEGDKARTLEHIKELGIETPFLLSVGTIEARKNLKRLFEAFGQIKSKGLFEGKLVVAGMKGWKVEDVDECLKKNGIQSDVIFTGFVSDEVLRYLYNLCEIFVFPSLYEGFGYPIVEAFSCGAPVISSKASSCPEITEDAALLIDPHNSDDIANAIERVLNDPSFKQELKVNGLARSLDFSFEKNAKETLKVYGQVYES